ncbi:cytoplasmic phosphatidylinositol transfer protein 1b isoform X1 [Tachysurus fulvidraco]|uniref:cytoplasmic phosphatidylinositol transfer protein 1b isoform X1 n=1 Tax=Tachysurus fulvidraco TaxID=1234273 RepID=UPI000F4EA38A|nr:cytoplasmic phosphatidylinositol transfer protein 1b isoform X1 [Tachysurus fulvidraco]
MLMKEYRICMPLTVDEYRIGQLYMINKHSLEQCEGGDGVEIIRNELDTHPKYGAGQVTEKRIYLSSKLPSWMKKFVPMIFYITEKAWNFYPYTITEYTCSFLPKLIIKIETHFENNNGSNDNVFEDIPTPKDSVSFLDILSDPIPEKYYKKDEDLSIWMSERTGRGPLLEGWRQNTNPIMCSYKRVQCSFEVYGFQGRTEEFIHRNIRDILLVGHRQAVAWIDEWHGMSLEEVREFEKQLQQETNEKMKNDMSGSGSVARVRPSFSRSVSVMDASSLKKMGVNTVDITDPPSSPCSSKFRSSMRLNSTPD